MATEGSAFLVEDRTYLCFSPAGEVSHELVALAERPRVRPCVPRHKARWAIFTRREMKIYIYIYIYIYNVCMYTFVTNLKQSLKTHESCRSIILAKIVLKPLLFIETERGRGGGGERYRDGDGPRRLRQRETISR